MSLYSEPKYRIDSLAMNTNTLKLLSMRMSDLILVELLSDVSGETKNKYPKAGNPKVRTASHSICLLAAETTPYR